MRRAATISALCACALLFADMAVPGAQAQTTQTATPEIVVAQNNNGVGGFFRRLFRPREAPAPQLREVTPSQPAPTRRQRANRPAPSPRAIAAVEKSEDASRVLVVGDFLARALAKGLALAYEENPDALVIDATSGSSGLVRNDYYDWPAALPGIAEAQNPDVIVVMVGGNDRQGITTDTGPYVLGTDGWRAAYAGRVKALADALRGTGKPILWVGLVPVQSSTMSRDYSAFNGIAREQLEALGIPFIETWNGFADEEGKYVAIGPDYRGQSVQLRASDGLNFTRAGQRTLAFFVERQLEEIFGGISPLLAATDPAALEAGEDGPQIGPMVSLDALATAGGDTLATGAANDAEGGEVETMADAIARRLAGEAPVPSGRADSYVWPPPSPRPAAEEATPPPPGVPGAAPPL